MQNANFNLGNKNIFSAGALTDGKNVQSQAEQQDSQKMQSIFGAGAKPATNDMQKAQGGSQGAAGVMSVFGGSGGASVSSGGDESIFAGITRNTSQYALYSKKDTDYDVPKLTQEDVAAQKTMPENERRTNPKPYNIDMTPKANPYEAFKNPEPEFDNPLKKMTDSFKDLFAQKGNKQMLN